MLETMISEAEAIRFITSGGFKAVYEAFIAGTKEALKVIFIPREEDEPEAHSEILGRVRREIESLRMCESPYLVKLGSLTPRSSVMGGHEYVVYSEEFLEGSTLHSLIQSAGRPTFEQCRSLFRCLLEVIRELRARGLIHRDIKPGNVIATDVPGRPYVVLDLGIAFKLHSTAITINPEMRQGTLPYMAPEMFEPRFREMLDYRSDLYSAAVTVYEYAAATHPIARRAENDFTTLHRIAYMKPKALSEHRPDLPFQFCELVDQMIRKKPALRPSNIDVAIKTLGEL
ncbi:MAG: serine/threonine-protein kinase [Candidatus Eisenbacteria bacterium]|nr:serine/threonine-protein kinase [Candidatus Eisenbacteria bacterium]